MSGEQSIRRGSRRAIAIALGDEQLTLNEIAAGTGRPAGSVRGLVHRMLADGIIESDEPVPRRGTQFWLAEEHKAGLSEPPVAVTPTGQLSDRQRLISVTGDVDDIAVVLATDEAGALVCWSAEFGERLLLGLELGSSLAEQTALLDSLKAAGLRAKATRLGEVLSGQAIRGIGTSVARRRRGRARKVVTV